MTLSLSRCHRSAGQSGLLRPQLALALYRTIYLTTGKPCILRSTCRASEIPKGADTDPQHWPDVGSGSAGKSFPRHAIPDAWPDLLAADPTGETITAPYGGHRRTFDGRCCCPRQAYRRHGSPHRCLASDKETAGSIRPRRRGFPPANLVLSSAPRPHGGVRSWKQDVSDHERSGAPRRGDRIRWSLAGEPRHRLSVTRYRAPRVCRRRGGRTSNRFEVSEATPQTAVILVVARRYSSGLLNFAHIHRRQKRDRKCRSARFERTAPKGLFQYRSAVIVEVHRP